FYFHHLKGHLPYFAVGWPRIFLIVTSPPKRKRNKPVNNTITHIVQNDLDQLKRYAKRLELYARRTREKIWQGNFIDALADTAEVSEISRRLYKPECSPPRRA